MKQFVRFSAVGALLLLLLVGTATAQDVVFTPGPAVTVSNPGANGGLAWGDINGDGNLDLLVPPNNILYNNITSFAAAASTKTANLNANNNIGGVLLADINGDGVLDHWSSNQSAPQTGLYYDSSGVFIGVTDPGDLLSADGTGIVFSGVAVADIDRSGYLTGAWARFNETVAGGAASDNLLYKPGLGVSMYKRTASGFVNVGAGADPGDIAIDTDFSFEAWQVHFLDANNDGWVDLLMPSFRHGFNPVDIQVDSIGARKGSILFLNDGTGKFEVPSGSYFNVDSIVAGVSYGRQVADTGIVVDDTVRHFGAIGSNWGDVNNDGFPDVVFTSTGAENWNGNGSLVRVVLIYGNGDGTFTYKWNGTDYANPGLPDVNNIRAWDFGDYNNDGLTDIFGSVTFGGVRMFRNNGDGTFTEVTSQINVTSGGGRGGGLVDYDNDGFMDIYTHQGTQSTLLKNGGNSNNWIAFTPVGTGNNKSAIGARFTVTTSDGLVETRWIKAEGNHGNSTGARANFGIGINSSITSLDVLWPDGTTASYTGLDINRYYTVVYGSVNPAAPVLATPADGATGEAVTGTLDWGDVAGAESYQVQVSMDPNFEDDLLLAVDETVLTSEYDYSLGAGTTYYWRVAASNGGFMSGYSGAFDFGTAGAAPATAPVHVSPADAATDQPAMQTLVVSNAADASRYQWQVSTLSTFTPLYATAVTADTTYDVQLVGGQTYYWRVRAVNDQGTSAYSSEESFTVQAVPAKPSQLSPANNSVNVIVDSVVFRWSAVSGAASYNLQVSTISSSSTYTTSDTTYKVFSLTRGANYTWKVEAINAGGTSNFTGNWAFTTVPPVPAAPAPISPASAEIDVPVLTTFVWSPSVNASKYHLQVSSDNVFTTVVVDTTVIDTTVTLASPLANSSDYYYRVSAENFGGASAYSTARLFSTAAISDVGDITEAPRTFALQQNYPNPFNPSTTISYDIPKSSHVSIKIYDLLGRVVATLVDEIQSPQSYRVVWNATGISSGMYFYRIDARSQDGSGNFTATKKLVLMK